MKEMIVSPVYEQLKKEIEELRRQLSESLFELDQLRLVVCVNIETEYMLQVGDLELKVFKAECEYLRLKRKMELIQKNVNYMQDVDMERIERQLDEEFQSFNEKLEEKMKMVNEALFSGELKSLDEMQMTEIRSLYRKIVRKLHPDMNPDLSEEEYRLFLNAVNAYKNGDLRAIRLIYRMIEDDEEEYICSSADEYRQLKYQLEDSLDDVTERIEQIKSQYPYIYQDILQDSNRVKQLRQEYERQLEEYADASKVMKERIDNLLGYQRYA